MPLYTLAATKAIRNAKEEAARLKSPAVTAAHLMLGILREPGNAAGSLLQGVQANRSQLRAALEAIPTPPGKPPEKGKPPMGADAKRALELAVKECKAHPIKAPSLFTKIRYKLSGAPLGTQHFLLALISMGGPVSEALQKHNVSNETMLPLLEFVSPKVG